MVDNSGEGPDSTGGGNKGAERRARKRSGVARKADGRVSATGDQAISEAVKEQVKGLYMQYYTKTQIEELTGVVPETVKSWAKRGKWLELREGINTELAKEINRRRAFTWSKIVNQSTEAIAKYVADVARKDKVESREAYNLSMILGQLDKAMRLAQGEPTDVVKHEGTVGLQAIAFKTEKEIRAALGNDPMTDPYDKLTNTMAKPGQRALDALEEEAIEVEVENIRGTGEEPS